MRLRGLLLVLVISSSYNGIQLVKRMSTNLNVAPSKVDHYLTALILEDSFQGIDKAIHYDSLDTNLKQFDILQIIQDMTFVC